MLKEASLIQLKAKRVWNPFQEIEFNKEIINDFEFGKYFFRSSILISF